MSVLAKALKATGLEMVGDALPPKDRKVKTFQRLIAAVRACEAEVMDTLSDAEHQLNESLRRNLTQQQENERLRAELLGHRLSEISALSPADRQKVLGPAEAVA